MFAMEYGVASALPGTTVISRLRLVSHVCPTEIAPSGIYLSARTATWTTYPRRFAIIPRWNVEVSRQLVVDT
jgi:hypothetical protein